jgi:hypothetical protein
MLANKGIIPIGLITTKRAMVDLKRSSPKISRNENKLCNIIALSPNSTYLARNIQIRYL